MTARSKRGDSSHVRAALVSALLLAAALAAPARSQTQHVTTVRAVTATASSGNVKVSGWATFGGVRVAYGTSKPGSAGPNGDQLGTDLTDAAIWYRPELTDLFIRWQVKKLPSTSTPVANIVGAPGVLYGLSTTIANTPIEIRVQSFGVSQRFALFKCSGESTCLLAGTLSGGFGTIDDEVVVSVPLATLAGFGLALKEGDQIDTPKAWTAFPASMDTPAPTSPQAMVDVIATAKTSRITIPAKSVTVSVGKYNTKAALTNGNFTAYLPRKAFPSNPAIVTTKTCVGSACIKQSFSIRF